MPRGHSTSKNSTSHHSVPDMAQPTLVSQLANHADSLSSSTPTGSSSVPPMGRSTQLHQTSPIQDSDHGGSTHFRSQLETIGVSSPIKSYIRNSLRPHSQACYKTEFKHWTVFCQQRNANPNRPVVKDVLEYFQFLVNTRGSTAPALKIIEYI